MTWTQYGTPLASYLAFVCATLCCWPGLIRHRDAPTVTRLFLVVMASEAVILLAVLIADMLLLTAYPGHPGLDHFRRVFSRWARAGLFAGVLGLLWWSALRQRPWRPLLGVWLVGLTCLLLLVGATPTPQGNAGLYGHTKSRIYHWPGCPNYPKGTVNLTRWEVLESPEQAVQKGYRAARNCRQTPPPTD